jgi:tRNA A-37 threonylcarbamoyl transferase component Bud32
MDTLLGQRYRLGDPIGTGGSARVYQAHDERLDRTVAVKVLDEEAANTADPALRRRFESEARTAAQFIHPNAVTIFDAGSDNGSLYLVMELVSGGSLAQRLADSGPMAPDRVALLGAQVAAALAAAHAAGIIHRDVKPANVLLDDDANAKLADFGIARRFDELADAMTSAGMVVGTRHYVSPEQAFGQPLGPATDIFSLGVTLYEAVTGTRPPDATERAADHRLDPRDVVPSVGAGLATAIGRSTALAVADRYASAAEFAEALIDAAAETSAPVGGGTAIMPEHLLPGSAAAAFAGGVGTAGAEPGTTMAVGATTPMTSAAPLPPTPQGPLRLGGRLAEERHQRRRQWRVAGLIMVAALVLGGLFVAFADDEASDAGSDASATSALPVDLPPATIPPDTTPTTTLPPTIAPTTLPPTTLAPTTLAPTTVPPPTEIIPGFPIPVDLEQFLVTLESDPDLAGREGEELSKELERVLDERPNRIGERAEELRKRIQEWVREEKLDPAVAAVAIVFLDELIATNPSPGPGADSDGDDD